MSLRQAKVVLEVILLERGLSNLKPWIRSARDYLAKAGARHLVRPENNLEGEWSASAQDQDRLMVKLEPPDERPPPLEPVAAPVPQDPEAALAQADAGQEQQQAAANAPAEQRPSPAEAAAAAGRSRALQAARQAAVEGLAAAAPGHADGASVDDLLTEVERVMIGDAKPYLSPADPSRYEDATESALRNKVFAELAKSLTLCEHLLVPVRVGNIYQLFRSVLNARSTTALTSMEAIAHLAELRKRPGKPISRLVTEITAIVDRCRSLGAQPITDNMKAQAFLRHARPTAVSTMRLPACPWRRRCRRTWSW